MPKTSRRKRSTDAPRSPTPKAATSGDKETQYDFYTLLPGKEVPMSDAELAASAREEEGARSASRRSSRGRGNAPADDADRADTASEQSTTPSSRQRGDRSRPRRRRSRRAQSAGNDARYILQAGAFGASGDAEATQGQDRAAGPVARVESAQIGGKTVYRVRMGPYGTASELAEAKQQARQRRLAGDGDQGAMKAGLAALKRLLVGHIRGRRIVLLWLLGFLTSLINGPGGAICGTFHGIPGSREPAGDRDRDGRRRLLWKAKGSSAWRC